MLCFRSMQAHDLFSIPSVDDLKPCFPDPPFTMSDDQPSSSPIHSQNEQNHESNSNKSTINGSRTSSSNKNNDCSYNNNSNNSLVRRERPSRACTARSAARLYAAAAAEAAITAAEKKRKAAARRERAAAAAAAAANDDENGGESEEEVEEDDDLNRSSKQVGKIVTPLVGEPEPSQLPRWTIRSMWELASILNFFNVFRPLLNIKVEFSVEEFETALLTPNNTLGDIHMPLLKAIPPITRMALGHNTWVTVLCRKLRDWWHWVAEGELPIVAAHGAEVEAYSALDPGVRVVILKALCDIRVEQEDIRNYIDDSIKQGFHLSTLRKERIGGDSHGISYWYEEDPLIGHRLYREIRKVEVKKGKGKTAQPIPSSCYQWETVATNLDEFQDVSEKLFSSKSRTEFSVGKKLKNDMLPEIEKVHKRREKLLKKQHRQALLLDVIPSMDGLASGRSLRDRKPVTYTFDDYERSINEAIKITKRKQPSPETNLRREGFRPDSMENGKWSGPSQMLNHVYFNMSSPKSHEYDETDENFNSGSLERGDRRRQRPQRYSAKEFVEALSDNDADLDSSDDDIVGEAVYDEEYLRRRRQRRKLSSSSEGDEEYQWDEDHVEEEEEDDDDDSMSLSEDSDQPRRFAKLPGRTRRGTKLRSVDELQSGLRRSKRATRNRINYRQYEYSESETESLKPRKLNASDEQTFASDHSEFSTESQDFEADDDKQNMKVDEPVQEHAVAEDKDQIQLPEKLGSPSHDDFEGPKRRRFLDLNELAPGSGFDDGPNSMVKDEDKDPF